jgi:hypothetical protein
MTDIRTLLHEAAPAPFAALDMTAVRERARRRGIRRIAALLLGAGMVVGVGAPFGIDALAPASRTERVGTVGVEHVDDAAPPNRLSTEVTVGTDRTASAAARAPAATTVVRRSATHESTPPSDYPVAAACSVNDVGLGAGEVRTCRFTASARGGGSFDYSGPTSPPPGVSPSGEVRVTRDGETTIHNMDAQEVFVGDTGTFRCSAFIEPGDRVEVVLTNSPTPRADDPTITLGAGENWECWSNRPT